MGRKVYISGKIAGDDGWKGKFMAAKAALEADGWTVLSPLMTAEAEGMDYEDYMAIDFAMIGVCDAVAFLPDWTDSPGARRERRFAEERGKELLDLKPDAEQDTPSGITRGCKALYSAVDRQLEAAADLFGGFKAAAALGEMAFFGALTMRSEGRIHPLLVLRAGCRDALEKEWHEYAGRAKGGQEEG